ncbi:hypothetical protein [Bifidobacterium moukalabense]|uniref:hypothetical protein n=1 Tax=Bifidobacterium moukalabense TaxID=1333651 RepID=UPI001484FC16|nr:hypothetical protein [Bifidobacterium moukalabense]
MVETREEVERREQAVHECHRELDTISTLARNSGIDLPEWTRKEQDHGRTR